MKKYGLIGFPLSHSFSKKFFNEKFKRENSDEIYENYEISSIDLLPEIIASDPNLIGLNVTIPYKEKVIPFLDELDYSSSEVGAVNTIRIVRKNGSVVLKGYNTDTFGFETSLKPLLNEFHKKALILGTGGASKAIKFVLRKLEIQFISASIEELMENEIPYELVDKKLIQEHLLIINATPLGTYPTADAFPPIPYEHIGNKHLLFDLVYNPAVTRFMEKGSARGAIVKNGLEMLELQALKSYSIWNAQDFQ